jgi:hypothetical protein
MKSVQQQQQQQQSAALIDPFGYGVSLPGSKGSSNGGGGGGGGVSSGGKAVLVAERLSKLWQQQQQQEAGGAAEGIPLPLLVAATVHPSAESFAAAEPYVSGPPGGGA